MVKEIAVFLTGMAIVIGVSLFNDKPKNKVRGDGTTLSERVELVHTRTRLRHKECSGAGFWECCGRATKIEAGGVFGSDVHLWPHKCSGCGQTNTLFNVRYPQIKSEWRVVR